MNGSYRFDGGPLDDHRLGPDGSPSIVRVQEPSGSYVQDVTTGTYRWYPAPTRVDALPCETTVDADALPMRSS